MKGTPAIYLGRIVNKDHFRTKVYGPQGETKLVESWAEYEAAMQSGLWFATRKDVDKSVQPKPKSKLKRRSKPKPVKVEELEKNESVIPHDELDNMVYEVTDGQ